MSHDHEIALRCKNVSKLYRLGEVGTGTLSHDLNRAWAKITRREDPTAKLGVVNDRALSGGNDYVWALQDINFQINQGEVFGFIGRNGAGKSTLLKLLSRITAPTEGSITINKRVASLLEVGTGFHPELTGRENIFLNGSLLGMTQAEIQRNFDEIVQFSGCNKYIDTPVKRYSSGMHVRLAFAIAAHLEAEILIVDEVLAVGDAEFQSKCLGKMRDLNQTSGRTVLFVSHNMALVEKLCDRSIVLDMGKIVFNGKTKEAIEYYLAHATKEAHHNLRNVENRSGEGRIKFTGIEILKGGSTQATQRVRSGDDIEIHVELENPDALAGINIAITIYDHREYIITDLVSQTQSFWPTLTDTNNKVVCHVPNLPFNKGVYYISLYCSTSGTKQDEVEKVAILEVEAGDFYGTGSLPHPDSGAALLQHHWKEL